MNLFIKCFILIILLNFGNSTLSPNKKKSKTKTQKVKYPKTNVMKRGLVKEDISSEEIIENHSKYCEVERLTRQFNNGEVLGYVTPWNSHGYDVAKTFGKFSMLSPVWLQIKRKPRGKYLVTGAHDIDQGWVKDVRKTNQNVKILPRVLFDGWSAADFKKLFSGDQNEDEMEDLSDAVVKSLLDEDLDGAVIELWSQLQKKDVKHVVHLMEHMSEAFRKEDLKIGLVIPPSIDYKNEVGTFTRKEFESLEPLVDFFSLMTYDFSASSGKPGANSPLPWVKACVEAIDPEAQNRGKILLGLNFYGFVYSKQSGGPILGHQYIELLQTHVNEIQWEPNIEEHIVQQTNGGEVLSAITYPTLQSIYNRIELARDLGTGIAIWEIGQGLDYFYDLL